MVTKFVDEWQSLHDRLFHRRFATQMLAVRNTDSKETNADRIGVCLRLLSEAGFGK